MELQLSDFWCSLLNSGHLSVRRPSLSQLHLSPMCCQFIVCSPSKSKAVKHSTATAPLLSGNFFLLPCVSKGISLSLSQDEPQQIQSLIQQPFSVAPTGSCKDFESRAHTRHLSRQSPLIKSPAVFCLNTSHLLSCTVVILYCHKWRLANQCPFKTAINKECSHLGFPASFLPAWIFTSPLWCL